MMDCMEAPHLKKQPLCLWLWLLLVLGLLSGCGDSGSGTFSDLEDKGNLCPTLSSKELRRFFRGESQWVEVRGSSPKVAPRQPLRLYVNFKKPFKSVIKRGGKVYGGIAQLCKTSKPSVIRIVDVKGNRIRLSRRGMKIRSKVLFFTHEYLPEDEVRAWSVELWDEEVELEPEIQ